MNGFINIKISEAEKELEELTKKKDAYKDNERMKQYYQSLCDFTRGKIEGMKLVQSEFLKS